MTERAARLAGAWYPATEAECLRTFDEFERDVVPYSGSAPLHGGVVPHAGWVYSGSIAYNVMCELARHAPSIDTVVLFGGHLGPSSPPAVMTSGAYYSFTSRGVRSSVPWSAKLTRMAITWLWGSVAAHAKTICVKE